MSPLRVKESCARVTITSRLRSPARGASAASAVNAPVVVTPCPRSAARDIDAASAVVAHDVRVRVRSVLLSCPRPKRSRVPAARRNSRASAILPRATDFVFVAKAVTPAIVHLDRHVKLMLLLGLQVHIPPRFLIVFAVVTACWLGA